MRCAVGPGALARAQAAALAAAPAAARVCAIVSPLLVKDVEGWQDELAPAVLRVGALEVEAEVGGVAAVDRAHEGAAGRAVGR